LTIKVVFFERELRRPFFLTQKLFGISEILSLFRDHTDVQLFNIDLGSFLELLLGV